MSLKFASIPQKRLLQGITSTSTEFYLNNVLSFDNENDVLPADLGTVHYCAFRNDTGTKVEFMQIDPTTISAGPITIVKRGLSYFGDLTTESTDRKLDWSANETIVMLGTDVPQIFQWLKEYIDNVVIQGGVDASTSQKGVVKMSVSPASPSEPIVVGTNDPRVPTANPNTLYVPKKTTGTTTSSATPSINVSLYDKYILSAQTTDISSFTTNLSGSSFDKDDLTLNIIPNSVVTFVNSALNNNSSSSSCVINTPSGTTNGDLMFATIGVYTGTISSAPAGWTLLGSQLTVYTTFYLYWKIASNEGSSHTWSLSGTVKNDGNIVTYRGGFNSSNPIKTSTNTLYTTSDNKIRAASLTTSANTTCLVFGGVVGNTSYSISTDPAGWTTDFTEGSQEFRTLRVERKTFSADTSTGDVDIIASASITTGDKHAFMVELDNTLNITWGTSFNSLDYTLPTSYYSNLEINLRYNSSTSKFDTISKLNKIVSVTSSYDMSTASGTKKIVHGLGKVPTFAKIKTIYNDTTITSVSEGVYTSSGNTCVYYLSTDGSSTTDLGSSSSYAVHIGTTNSAYQTGIITVDNSFVTITFTKTSTPTGTAYILLEVE